MARRDGNKRRQEGNIDVNYVLERLRTLHVALGHARLLGKAACVDFARGGVLGRGSLGRRQSAGKAQGAGSKGLPQAFVAHPYRDLSTSQDSQ